MGKKITEKSRTYIFPEPRIPEQYISEELLDVISVEERPDKCHIVHCKNGDHFIHNDYIKILTVPAD